MMYVRFPPSLRNVEDLTRRTSHLEAVAPKLRAKGAGDAVEIFEGGLVMVGSEFAGIGLVRGAKE